MEITYFGHSSFRVKNKLATLVTDPYDPSVVGRKYPRNTEADIVTISHDHADHNASGEIGGSPFIIHGPGEYEIKGVSVIGIPTYHDDCMGKERGKNTAYRIEMDGLRIGHLGDIGHLLTAEQTDMLDGIDILMIPVGNVHTIDAKTAAAIVSDVAPQIVIPMHYLTDAHAAGLWKNLHPISEFLQVMNKGLIVPIQKLSITKDKLPQEMQVVVFE